MRLSLVGGVRRQVESGRRFGDGLGLVGGVRSRRTMGVRGLLGKSGKRD